jgi:hypothetical protein
VADHITKKSGTHCYAEMIHAATAGHSASLDIGLSYRDVPHHFASAALQMSLRGRSHEGVFIESLSCRKVLLVRRENRIGLRRRSTGSVNCSSMKLEALKCSVKRSRRR